MCCCKVFRTQHSCSCSGSLPLSPFAVRLLIIVASLQTEKTALLTSCIIGFTRSKRILIPAERGKRAHSGVEKQSTKTPTFRYSLCRRHRHCFYHHYCRMPVSGSLTHTHREAGTHFVSLLSSVMSFAPSKINGLLSPTHAASLLSLLARVSQIREPLK